MEATIHCYEGMFLLDAGQPNPDTALEPVRTVLDRAGAEILTIKPWEERRLAYEIRGRKRGLYVLSYFKAGAEKIVELEHDCLLNEKILRSLILRKEHVTEAELQTQTPAETAASAAVSDEPAEPRPADSEKNKDENKDDANDADDKSTKSDGEE